MVKIRIFLILIIVAVFASCASVVTVQKAESTITQNTSIDTVICITPEILVFNSNLFSSINVEKTIKYQDFFYKNFEKYSKKASDIHFKIYHPSFGEQLNESYFNDLIPLKNEIVETVLERNSSINNTFLVGGKAFKKSVFAEVPLISPDYSHLAEKYNTPYFSWYGVFVSNNATVISFSIVNVETMELVIKEMIYVDRGLTKRSLLPLLYDSFKFIGK